MRGGCARKDALRGKRTRGCTSTGKVYEEEGGLLTGRPAGLGVTLVVVGGEVSG